MRIWTRKSASIQPRTSLRKSDVETRTSQRSSAAPQRSAARSPRGEATPRHITLSEARSRLYQRRFSRPNTHFSAFFEIYKNIIPLHRSKFNNLANSRRTVFAIFKNSSKILIFFTISIEFYTDFDENFSEFRKNP